MIKIECWGNSEDYFERDILVGKADEIKALYKSLNRHYDKCRYYPLFTDFPKFNTSKLYGLAIDEDDSFTIINSDVLSRMLLDNQINKKFIYYK